MGDDDMATSYTSMRSINEALDPHMDKDSYRVTEYQGYFYKLGAWRGPFATSQQALDSMGERQVPYIPGSIIFGTAIVADDKRIVSFLTKDLSEVKFTNIKQEEYGVVRFPRKTAPRMNIEDSAVILAIKSTSKKLLAIFAGAMGPILGWFKKPNQSVSSK